MNTLAQNIKLAQDLTFSTGNSFITLILYLLRYIINDRVIALSNLTFNPTLKL